MKSGYTVSREGFDATYNELDRLYREHYTEMCERLETIGVHLSPYNPRLKDYSEASRLGSLITFVLRYNGVAVGHSNIYLANDMHNNELNAHEDTIYVTPGHRNGVGREFIKAIIEHLRSMGIRRWYAASVTDMRVAKLWNRMGFKHHAEQMVYHF